MSILRISSTKFDGSLHYDYAVQQVERTASRLVTFAQPGVAITSYRGSWTGKYHLLSFFWAGKPFVLHVRWTKDWQPDHLYVDIASATSWADGIVTYIDMDLDLIQRAGSSEIELDDEDEFELHRVRLNYPTVLVAACRAAVDEVRGLLSAGTAPFNSALFAWRPGSVLPP